MLNLFDFLSMVRRNNEFFLTSGSLITDFACFRLIFCLICVIYHSPWDDFFTYHGLKFEVVYLGSSDIALIHVSRTVVISMNALEKFIVWVFYSLEPLLVRSFLNMLFLIILRSTVIM